MHFLFWGESIIKIYELQSTWCWQQNQPNTHNRKKKTATKTIWAAVQSRNSSPLSVYLHWRSFYGIFQAFSSSTWAYKVRFSVISAAPAGFMHRFHRCLSHCCAPSVKTVAELTFTWKCHGLLSQTWRLRRTHDENIEGGIRDDSCGRSHELTHNCQRTSDGDGERHCSPWGGGVYSHGGTEKSPRTPTGTGRLSYCEFKLNGGQC